MAQHIVLMNVVALGLALAVPRHFAPALARGPGYATAAQLLLLWFWHAPPVLDAVLASPLLHLLMQVSLYLVALWFWRAIFAMADTARWRAVGLLLVTGKLFCVLGALLVFAGRALFALPAAGHGHHGGAVDLLADQQMAGLLMLAACPVSYLVAGVIIAARWLAALERQAAHG